jgi:hypothetical protein
MTREQTNREVEKEMWQQKVWRKGKDPTAWERTILPAGEKPCVFRVDFQPTVKTRRDGFFHLRAATRNVSEISEKLFELVLLP